MLWIYGSHELATAKGHHEFTTLSDFNIAVSHLTSLVPRPSRIRHLQYETIHSEGLVHFIT